MFTLSGLFLEDGENLFRDFWSPFSISFLSFSARRNYLKKVKPTLGRTRAGLHPKPSPAPLPPPRPLAAGAAPPAADRSRPATVAGPRRGSRRFF